MENLVGQSLDRYHIIDLLGEGGMGAVLKARDITLQREVAVKVMHPQFARQPDFRERFLQEARTAAKLDHPGIVKVHDFGQAQGHLYIVMEFIPGDNLRKMLENLKATSQWIVLPEAIQLLRQVCLAIDYAHHHGVLHRDIKPDNIMLKPEPSHDLPYRPVLTDLGLAKLVEGGLLTQEGVSMGTPAYMSPEQARGEKTDGRSDVYSLGILLYELAVGQLPFRIRTLTEAIRSHTQDPPPPPRSLRPDLPQALEAVILQALEKDPNDRFPNAKSLATALQNLDEATLLATAPPTAQAGAVSLLTQYQSSLVEPRGHSILDEFPKATSDLTQDRIQILSPDRTSRSVSMKAGGLTIGRSADNDLTLDSSNISRHHARIEFDGTNYRVTDLDSTNGTYLMNVKLLPGVAEVWTPDKPLRIGDIWLQMQRAQRQPTMGTAIYRSDGTMVDPSLIHSSRGTGRIGVFAEVQQLTVAPGSATTMPVVVLNQGGVVDHFATTVRGIPGNWLSVAPSPVRLMPGQQQEVIITIQPPRAPASRAGRYPLTVQVVSEDAPDEVAEVKQTLTVAAYSQHSSSLQPQRVRAGSPAQVTVQNQGNTQETFTLTWNDRADELTFEPGQAQLTVVEGGSAATKFRATPRQVRWIGGEKAHPFSVQVSTREAEVQSHSGELVSKGLLPAWILPLLLFLCLILAAAAVWGFGERSKHIAQVTATAIASETVGALGDAAVLTATAQADTDGDGLSDTDELRLGTDPSNPDTDGDGLSDKEEVDGGITQATNADTDSDGLSDGDEKRWGSNPEVRDTDGDTLLDGQEANGWRRGDQVFYTSPINRDTDGDSLPDNTDPDPGQLPTPTPRPTSTSTPTVTPRPTPTSKPTATTRPTNTPKPTKDPSSIDTDGDGLNDGQEQSIGTDPKNPDTDSDGLNDGQEQSIGTDPKNPDTDGDGLNDGQEQSIGTDPKKPDTDGDGLNDGQEQSIGSDPTSADSDGDGLNDGQEQSIGSNPKNPDTDGDGVNDGQEQSIGSDPTSADSDSDGLNDGQEQSIGSDPTRADSDGDGYQDGEEHSAGTSPTDPASHPIPQPQEDCIGFNPARIEVQNIGGRWKIVDGNSWLMDFEDKEDEARRAFDIIRYYGFSRYCFVGRPDPSMRYFLVGSQAPTGSLSGEDCVSFDPAAIEVQYVSGRWKIVEPGHSMMDFEDKEDEARSAFDIIKYYGFNRYCFVGRPNPSMTYFRR